MILQLRNVSSIDVLVSLCKDIWVSLGVVVSGWYSWGMSPGSIPARGTQLHISLFYIKLISIK